MRRPLEKTITNDDSRSWANGPGPNCMHMHRCLRFLVYALAGALESCPPPKLGACIDAYHSPPVCPPTSSITMAQEFQPRHGAAIDKGKSLIPPSPAPSLAVSLSRTPIPMVPPSCSYVLSARLSLRDLSEPPDR